MAGIGFELKGLFKKRGLFYNIKGYFISAVVTIGPTLLCIFLILGMQSIMRNMGESYKQIDFFVTLLVYCFAFSLIITGGFSLLSSRYISDCIYRGQQSKILPSFFGVISIVLVIDFIITNLFFLPSGIESYVKISAIVLLGELSIVWIESIYISSLKDYMSISISFLIGIATIFFCYLFMVYSLKINIFDSALFSVVFGFFVMMILFIVKIFESFWESNFTYKECFEIVASLSEYPENFITGFLYYLGMYVHTFIFWFSTNGISIENTFKVAPFYDTPLFYSLLSLLPMTILFQVRTETSFFPKYKKYYLLCQDKGNIQDINLARNDMISTLHSELKTLIEIQLFVSFAFIAFGMKFLPQIGLSAFSIDIFSILVLGSMSFSIMQIINTFLLYFDNRRTAMKVSVVFITLNILLTLLSLFLGEGLYGYGFFAASLISVIFAYKKLTSFLEEIDYFTFASQPMFVKETTGFFKRLYSDKIMKGEKANEKL
jgi:uncharacterized membrane protein